MLDLSIVHLSRYTGETTVSFVVRIGEYFTNMSDTEWNSLPLNIKVYSNNIIKYIMNNRLF